jgi:hypothetical protein
MKRLHLLPFAILRAATLAAAAAALAATLAACGFGNKPDLPPILPDELQVGSSQAGGGDLGILFDFAEPVPVTRSATVGPLVLYASIEPPFDGLVEADPDVPLFPLDGEVGVAVEILAIDAGAQVRMDGVVLDAAGKSAEIAIGPGSHVHPEWRVTAPEGTTPEPHRVTFRLVDASGRYGSSVAYTLTLVVTGE